MNALGVASVGGAVGLAGCSSDGGGDGGDGGGGDGGGGDGGGGGGDGGMDLGERVPTVVFEWWNNFSPSRENELSAPLIVEDLSQLGLEVNQAGVGALDILAKVNNDTRELHLSTTYKTPNAPRLDPGNMFSRWSVFSAGNNGLSNGYNYANCEFEEIYQQTKQMLDSPEKRELVYEANRMINEASAVWNMMGQLRLGGWNTTEVDIQGEGLRGIKTDNVRWMIESQATTDDNTILINAPPDMTSVPIVNLMAEANSSHGPWNKLVHSTLLEYDGDFNLEPGIAEDWESSDDGTELTFMLNSDASWHNGEPVTAEDVKFSWEFYQENNSLFPDGLPTAIDTIDIVDDQTVVFNTSRPDPLLFSAAIPTWAIVPKDVYEAAGAWESPDNFDPRDGVEDDDLIFLGNGPFKVTGFSQGGSLQLEPWDGHHKHQPNSNVIFQPFDSTSTAARAFLQGQINVVSGFPLARVNEIQDHPDLETSVAGGWVFFEIVPQNQYPPFKFKELRRAGNYVLNRDRIVEVAAGGVAEPSPAPLIMSPAHPSFDVEDLDELEADGFDVAPTGGDVEAARGFLEEAGWGWDGDGRLHYPPDADLSAHWPEGSQPSEHPDRYPCVEDYEGL